MFLSSLRASCAASPWFELGLGWMILLILTAFTSMLLSLVAGFPPSVWSIAVSQISTWLLAAWLMVRLNGYSLFWIAVRPPDHRAQIPLGALLALLVMPLAFAVGFTDATFHLPEAFASLEQGIKDQHHQNQDIVLQYMQPAGAWALAVKLVAFALLPALVEELFFRGWMLRTLARRLRVHEAVILTAVIFSLVHFDVYGIFTRTLLGIVLGYTVWYSRSLLPAIVLHAVFNGVQIALMHLMGGEADLMAEDLPGIPPLYTLLSGLSVAAVMGVYVRLRKSESQPE